MDRSIGRILCVGTDADRLVLVARAGGDALSDAVISEMASVADHIALGIERARSTEALRTAHAIVFTQWT